MSSKVNIVIEQGTTFSVAFDVEDDSGTALNLTGYTGRSQLRKHYSSTANTPFTVNVANGSVTLSLTANQTANVVAGRYVYDVELVDSNGVVSRLIEGIASVTPEVTR